MENSSFEHVTIKSPRSGIVMAVTTVEQAYDVLTNGWTTSKGPGYSVAHRTCRAALQGKSSAMKARAAFIKAAKEVDAYVEEKTLKSSKWPVSL